MGQCGCSDTNPLYRFPGPDGVHYGIEIYPSCHYCVTPVGVTIYRFDNDGAREWLEYVDEAPFMPYAADRPVEAILSIPVLGAEELAAAISNDQREDAEYNGADDEDYREVAEQDIRCALPDAVLATLDAWTRTVAEGTTHTEEGT
jgi:hypothetical protein